MSEPTGTPLSTLRSEIDAIDARLIQLLGARRRVVERISASKAQSPGQGRRDFDRERIVRERWRDLAAAHGLPAAIADRVLDDVLGDGSWERPPARGDLPASRPWVRNVGYQGEPACYSELIARRMFGEEGERPEFTGFHSFAALFDALEDQRIDVAVVPVENTLSGAVPEVSHHLMERRVFAIEEHALQIEHCLAALPGTTLADLRSVRSHPVALEQCRLWLREHPAIRPEAYYDTAGAALAVSKGADVTAAALCSVEAAERYGLAVLAHRCADHSENWTRFLGLARSEDEAFAAPAVEGSKAKTSIFVTLDHTAGALEAALRAFSERAINLTRIESRPWPGHPWEYRFLIDLEGHPGDSSVAAALAALGALTRRCRILGCYRDCVRSASPTGGGKAPGTLPTESHPPTWIYDDGAPEA